MFKFPNLANCNLKRKRKRNGSKCQNLVTENLKIKKYMAKMSHFNHLKFSFQ